MHLIQQFGVGMDVAAPCHDVRLQVGDTVDDGHDKSWFGCVLAGLAQGSTFAQYSPRSIVMAGLHEVRVWKVSKCLKRSRASSTISWLAPVRPGASWPTGCRKTPSTAC